MESKVAVEGQEVPLALVPGAEDKSVADFSKFEFHENKVDDIVNIAGDVAVMYSAHRAKGKLSGWIPWSDTPENNTLMGLIGVDVAQVTDKDKLLVPPHYTEAEMQKSPLFKALSAKLGVTAQAVWFTCVVINAFTNIYLRGVTLESLSDVKLLDQIKEMSKGTPMTKFGFTTLSLNIMFGANIRGDAPPVVIKMGGAFLSATVGVSYAMLQASRGDQTMMISKYKSAAIKLHTLVMPNEAQYPLEKAILALRDFKEICKTTGLTSNILDTLKGARFGSPDFAGSPVGQCSAKQHFKLVMKTGNNISSGINNPKAVILSRAKAMNALIAMSPKFKRLMIVEDSTSRTRRGTRNP